MTLILFFAGGADFDNVENDVQLHVLNAKRDTPNSVPTLHNTDRPVQVRVRKSEIFQSYFLEKSDNIFKKILKK